MTCSAGCCLFNLTELLLVEDFAPKYLFDAILFLFNTLFLLVLNYLKE